MLLRDCGLAKRVAFGKSGVFHQPGRRDFMLLLKRGIPWDVKAHCLCPLAQVTILRLAQYGIFEERTCAAAVGVIERDEHSLFRANGAHCRPHLRQRWPLRGGDRKSTRLNSSHVSISYAVL